jgi:hypothetical protein
MHKIKEKFPAMLCAKQATATSCPFVSGLFKSQDLQRFKEQVNILLASYFFL